MRGRPWRKRASGHAESPVAFSNRPLNPRQGRDDKQTFATAERNYRQYLALAREASSNGDSVEMENFYQHAEHYFRVMRATRATGD